jgi:hypothetical protein
MELQNPYSPPNTDKRAATQKHGNSPSFSRFLVAWLCFCASTFFISTATSLTIGAVLVGILFAIDADISTAERVKPIYATIGGFFVPIPISLLCYWWTVRRFILKGLASAPE